jgi:hypothetical protein
LIKDVLFLSGNCLFATVFVYYWRLKMSEKKKKHYTRRGFLRNAALTLATTESATILSVFEQSGVKNMSIPSKGGQYNQKNLLVVPIITTLRK